MAKATLIDVLSDAMRHELVEALVIASLEEPGGRGIKRLLRCMAKLCRERAESHASMARQFAKADGQASNAAHALYRKWLAMERDLVSRSLGAPR